jgi:hypothetical protein
MAAQLAASQEGLSSMSESYQICIGAGLYHDLFQTLNCMLVYPEFLL